LVVGPDADGPALRVPPGVLQRQADGRGHLRHRHAEFDAPVADGFGSLLSPVGAPREDLLAHGVDVRLARRRLECGVRPAVHPAHLLIEARLGQGAEFIDWRGALDAGGEGAEHDHQHASAQGLCHTVAGSSTVTSVVTELAKICVAQSKQDPTVEASAEKLNGMSQWTRGDFVKEKGWAVMPGIDTPDDAVMTECGRLVGGAT